MVLEQFRWIFEYMIIEFFLIWTKIRIDFYTDIESDTCFDQKE